MDNVFTCLAIRSMMRSISSPGHSNSSGAVRSDTQDRVSSCRSWCAAEEDEVDVCELSMSARMSSISILRVQALELLLFEIYAKGVDTPIIHSIMYYVTLAC
jgi:hypothetical protein